MTKARDDKRIGLPVPYDPSRLVNTFWDIGMDETASGSTRPMACGTA